MESLYVDQPIIHISKHYLSSRRNQLESYLVGAKYNKHTNPLFKELKLLKLNDIHDFQSINLFRNMYMQI